MLPAGNRPATSWVHHTTSCKTQSSAPEDGQNNCPKYVELTGIINKPLFLHLVVCLYYWYQWCTVKQILDNEIYLLIKYIKSVLWRVKKRLSYIEDERCVKFNGFSRRTPFSGLKLFIRLHDSRWDGLSLNATNVDMNDGCVKLWKETKCTFPILARKGESNK